MRFLWESLSRQGFLKFFTAILLKFHKKDLYLCAIIRSRLFTLRFNIVKRGF